MIDSGQKRSEFDLLKLTKKADYGLIALRHLASMNTSSGAPATASAKDIADAYHLPVPLLAKVLQKLTKARILRSVSGTNGGYGLARDPRDISALEVIRAIDGPVILTHCFTEHGICDQSDNCTVREPLRKVHEAILDLLNGFTITDLAEPALVKLTPLRLPLNQPALHQ
jgi:Rrf2 family protein